MRRHVQQVIKVADATTLEAPFLKVFQCLLVIGNELFHLGEVAPGRLFVSHTGSVHDLRLSGSQGLIADRFLTFEGVQGGFQLFALLLLDPTLRAQLALQALTTGSPAQAQASIDNPLALSVMRQ